MLLIPDQKRGSRKWFFEKKQSILRLGGYEAWEEAVDAWHSFILADDTERMFKGADAIEAIEDGLIKKREKRGYGVTLDG